LKVPVQAVLLALSGTLLWGDAHAVERPDTTFRIFQFPANAIPRIDSDVSDRATAPASYSIGMDQLVDSSQGGRGAEFDRADLDRLYFLYETYDNYRDFIHTDLHNDIFKMVVGCMSAGPLID
jgi:hypothetical protein